MVYNFETHKFMWIDENFHSYEFKKNVNSLIRVKIWKVFTLYLYN